MSYAEFKNLSERNQAFILLCALREGDRAAALLEHVVDAPVEKMRATLTALQKVPKAQLQEDLWDPMMVSAGATGDQLFQFAESGWILENFKNESPRILAWILSRIPKAKSGRVLSELPKETRKALKNIKLKPLHPGVENYLVKRCQERFPKIPLEQVRGKGVFDRLSELKADYFLKLIRELGLGEMSIAFSKIDRAATRAILHRLNLQDAKELRHRIKESGDFPLAMQREAQLNILSLDMDSISADELPYEIGFAVFSKAFSKDDIAVTPLFIYKLPQRQGYILKRYLDQNATANSNEIAARMQERVSETFEQIRQKFEE